MIKFGTDGWRAIIDQEFTDENVRLVTQALINYAKEAGLDKKGIAIGYDNRLRSEDFASVATEVCSGAGIKVYLTAHSVPSPVLSYAVKNMGLGIGIMITASHNPPEWNGFKVKENFGGSAFPETTQAIEKKLENALRITPSPKKITVFDPDPEYLARIKSLVNLDLIKNGRLNIMVDAMHGSGAGYFKKLGLEVNELRGNRDTSFGGINPEPIALNLQSSMLKVKEVADKFKDKLTACIVLDGDADRLAGIDANGKFINTHNIFSLLLRHLAFHKKVTGEVVKTFNLSNLIDKLCKQYSRNLIVTPIGFKHIAKLMLEKEVVLGGEESGGMGIKGFIPERDGILAGLNLLELMAIENKTLGEILDAIMREHGYFYYDRLDVHADKAQEIVKQLKENPPSSFADKKIVKIETLDGLKFNFEDEGWILFRTSGTEPLLRIYCEGRSPEEVKALLAESKKLL